MLDLNFSATAPNRKWACDLTYVWTDERCLYLSVVIDLFSRRIVGWSMNEHMKASGIADALVVALARRKPDLGPLHHSDRGVQSAACCIASCCAITASRAA